MSETQPPALPEAQVARRQLQLVLLLDCSGSMTGEKIASLNYAIRAALSELQEVAHDNPEVDLRLSAITFSSEASWHIEVPAPIHQIEWQDVSAGGETAMGAALGLATELLTGPHFGGRQLPPILLLVTDGYATDDFDTAFEDFQKTEAVAHATRLAVSIGDAADTDTLELFSDTPRTGIAPLNARNAPDLVKFIKWATTAPAKAASAPKNAPTENDRLAAEADALLSDDSELVW